MAAAVGRRRKGTRFAVLGAGAAGACTALELAGRGHAVDLYDENSQPVSRASRHNEGKIHLGLIYARDPSLRTARTLILGAVHFLPCLRRWIDIDADDVTGAPYHYGVHRGTMTGADALAAHYDRCRQLLEDACAATGLTYLDGERTLVAEEVPAKDLEALVSPEHFLTAFRTSELAVDPRVIADRLGAAVAASSHIRFVPDARVSGIARSDAGTLDVSIQRQGDDYTEPYDQVVNTLWHGRLEIDAQLGLAPRRGWLHRYKVGGWIDHPVSDAVPSMTCVLGPFGDIVNLGARGLYFSWYPAGLLGTSQALRVPDWEASLSAARQSAILRRSWDEWLVRCPALGSVPYDNASVAPVGGHIFAWGTRDIDDGRSALHSRYDIGVHTTGNYHSVNTGKYGMAPYLGCQTTERVLGVG